MATTIRIDPDDELPAILERLPRHSACILVLPPHARALNSVVGAKLLARRAEGLGTRVVVVSEDRAVTAHVRAAGIPVVATVAEAMSSLPAPPIFEEAKPVAAEAEPAVDGNGNSHASDVGVEGHDAATAPHAVAEPAAPAAPRSGDGAAKGPTYRFTAPTPAHQESTPQAPNGRDTGGEQEEDIPPFVRGHSGTRTARRGGGAAARGTTGRTTPPASPAARTVSGGTRAGVLGRLREGLASERLTRILAPALIGLILLVLLIWLGTAVLGGLFNPSATLSIQPRTNTISNSIVLHTYTALPAAKRDLTHILRQEVASNEVKRTIPLPVDGTQVVPGKTATGQLELRNLVARPQSVPAGTRFTTSLNAHTFVTTADVTVPAAKITFNGAEYGKASVPIKAAQGGKSGNVAAKTIVNPPAAFSGALIATNLAPTTGGTDVTEKVVRQSDVDAAASKLFAQLEQQAHQDIASKYGANLEQHTLWVSRSPVVPHLAADRNSATLTLSIVLHASLVHKSDLQAAAQTAIGTPPNLVQGSVTYKPVWRPDQSIQLVATGRTEAPIDTPRILDNINGRSKADAEVYLSRQPNIASYHLSLSPGWSDHLPSDLAHIHVDVQKPQ